MGHAAMPPPCRFPPPPTVTCPSYHPRLPHRPPALVAPEPVAHARRPVPRSGARDSRRAARASRASSDHLPCGAPMPCRRAAAQATGVTPPRCAVCRAVQGRTRTKQGDSPQLAAHALLSSSHRTCLSLIETNNDPRILGAAIIVIRTGPGIEPVMPSICWFIGPTVKNRLNHWFDSIGPMN
jgi:hypothetical protein